MYGVIQRRSYGYKVQCLCSTVNMDFYAANGVLIDRAAVMEGMAIYHAIGDRIGELWKPSNGPIEDFKSKQFAGICEELKVTKERRRVYVSLPDDISYILTLFFSTARSCDQ